MSRAAQEQSQLPKIEIIQNEAKNLVPNLDEVIKKIEDILNISTMPNIDYIKLIRDSNVATPANLV